MFSKSIASLAAVLALTVAPAMADEIKPATPTSVKGARIITVDEAKSLLDKKAASFFDALCLPRQAKPFGTAGFTTILLFHQSGYRGIRA